MKLSDEIRNLSAPAPGKRGGDPVQAAQKIVLDVAGGGIVAVLLEKLQNVAPETLGVAGVIRAAQNVEKRPAEAAAGDGLILEEPQKFPLAHMEHVQNLGEVTCGPGPKAGGDHRLRPARQ